MATKALAKMQEGSIEQFTPQQVGILKSLIAKDATDDELRLFAMVCKRTGLDPFSRQIYFQKRNEHGGDNKRMVVISSIDGFRTIAHRTKEHAGTDDPIYERDNDGSPTKATVTVYRFVQGQKCAFTASARWKEYYPGDKLGFMWRKMPDLMLGKCAEALALRKAFSAELGGLYTPDEMAQADAPASAREYTLPERTSEASKNQVTDSGPNKTVTPEEKKVAWNKLRKDCKLTEEQAKNVIASVMGSQSSDGMTYEQMDAALELGYKIANPKTEETAT